MSDLQIISSINEMIALTFPEILLRQASRLCAPVLTQTAWLRRPDRLRTDHSKRE
jgi:hypothetical protein